MITSLTEMLELPNFGHIAASTVCFELLQKFVGDVMYRIYLKHLYFKMT